MVIYFSFAMRNMATRTHIIIKPADKNGGIVIMNKDDYISEGYRQLKNTRFYKALDIDATN